METKTSVQIEKGNAFIYYAFDVGLAIDLKKADLAMSDATRRINADERKRSFKYFEFSSPPLKVTRETPTIVLTEKLQTLPRVDLLIFDFGSVSIRYQIPLNGDFDDLIALSSNLYENQALITSARATLTLVFEQIKLFIDRPELKMRTEDYVIFHLEKLQPAMTTPELLQKKIIEIACVLRAESISPSDRELQEILSDRISYGANDVTLMSWHAAVIYGTGAEDIYTVLEYANLVLMELTDLDMHLDDSLDEFYDYFTHHEQKQFLGFSFRGRSTELRKISRFHIDSAISFERVTNALKLLGDEFQARVFLVATKKMGLSLWNTSISRKLAAIESIYDKISDSEAARRMEFLEWIIIILFAISILISLFPGAVH